MHNEALQNPRVIVIQKLYEHHLNKDSEITFPKHRYKNLLKMLLMEQLKERN